MLRGRFAFSGSRGMFPRLRQANESAIAKPETRLNILHTTLPGVSSNTTPSAQSFIRLKLSERGERERNEERYEREEARSPPALRLEAPIRFLGRLERAHRGEQERKRQDKLDNCAQNSDNDGVEITGTHDLLLLKKRPAYSKWNDCIGPFCFFRLTRGFPRLRQAKNPQWQT